MHQYLRAIGFSDVTKQDMETLVKDTWDHFEYHEIVNEGESMNFAEVSKPFAEQMGIAIRGEYTSEDEFEWEYYYPYFKGEGITSTEEVTVERHADGDAYSGVCDDVKIGVTLIFYLQNIAEYLNHIGDHSLNRSYTVTLSGLSNSGKILLPISKNESQIKNDREASINRNKLIAAARNGDEDAIGSLTLEDMDMYSMISRRIMYEDVLSIVDTYFMPYGVECDQYSIMGEILNYQLVENSITKEEIYILTLDCNELTFDICINKDDLVGEPESGRRFRGTIWLQGSINYEE